MKSKVVVEESSKATTPKTQPPTLDPQELIEKAREYSKGDNALTQLVESWAERPRGVVNRPPFSDLLKCNWKSYFVVLYRGVLDPGNRSRFKMCF